MESKIFIDIYSDGQPQIRIDYDNVNTGDVRDKLIARFLFDVIYGNPKTIDVSLEHGHSADAGTVAFIRLKPKELTAAEEIPDAGKIKREVLKKADDWAVLNLKPDLYKEWHTEMFGYPPLKK